MKPNQAVITIDCEYLQPRFAAAYLLVEEGRAAFIENNTAHSVPLLLDALRGAGLTPRQVEYLIVTHVHLDHAGGSSVLMRACPDATLLAHPRAVPHLIDPTKLVASARKVYGDDVFQRLYGEVAPIEERRVRAMGDGETLRFGTRQLRFIHTRGHANHHFCVYDDKSEGIFTGDAFGLAYPDLQSRGLFIFPSTSPTDFIPSEAKQSIRRILDTGARRAYLTHFGEVTALEEAARQLDDHLDFSEKLLNEAVASGEEERELEAVCEERLRDHFDEVLRRRGISSSDPRVWSLLRLDLELNAQGIAHAAGKLRRAASRSDPAHFP